MAVQIQVRRGTAANAAANNETLSIGEIGFETDTGRIKIGNGAAAWNALPYRDPLRSLVAIGTDGTL